MLGCEGIMQGTPKAGDVRSEQLNAMGNPMQGVLGALQVISPHVDQQFSGLPYGHHSRGTVDAAHRPACKVRSVLE